MTTENTLEEQTTTESEDTNLVQTQETSPETVSDKPDIGFNLADVFEDLDKRNNLSARTTEDTSNEEQEVDTKEDTDTEDTDLPSKEADKTTDSTDEVEDTNEPTIEEKIALLEKRVKDTQAFANKAQMTNKFVKDKLESGEITQEEAVSMLAEGVTSTPDSMEATLKEINEALPAAEAAAIAFTGKTPEEISKQIQAFDEMASVDKTLMSELMELSVSERATFIIKKGGELSNVHKILGENDGSVIKALSSIKDISTRKEQAIRDEVTKQVTKELEAKYENYVSSSANKPKLKGTSPDRGAKDTGKNTPVSLSGFM